MTHLLIDDFDLSFDFVRWMGEALHAFVSPMPLSSDITDALRFNELLPPALLVFVEALRGRLGGDCCSETGTLSGVMQARLGGENGVGRLLLPADGIMVELSDATGHCVVVTDASMRIVVMLSTKTDVVAMAEICGRISVFDKSTQGGPGKVPGLRIPASDEADRKLLDVPKALRYI